LVVVGTSLGGLAALEVLLSGLPTAFGLPVAIVQHRTDDAGDLLRATLGQRSALPVREPVDKEEIRPGQVYLAPAGYHLMVDRHCFSLSTEGPVAHARPSVDVLFETAADAYAEEAVGVVLTGSSHDGAYGAACIQGRGGLVVIQEPDSAASDIMPRAALAAATSGRVLQLGAIAPFLAQLGCCDTGRTP
jgi:two-component system chemotaxis response regulator CheB